MLTGWQSHPQQGNSPLKPGFPTGVWPWIGATVSKLRGPVDPSGPPFVSLSLPNTESTTRAFLNQPGFLGIGHADFEPSDATSFTGPASPGSRSIATAKPRPISC